MIHVGEAFDCTFKSQQEIWRYLSESIENKVISKTGVIVGFSTDGNLFNYQDASYCVLDGKFYDFSDVRNWKKYTESSKI